MDEIIKNIEKKFGVELGCILDEHFDANIPDQKIYFFKKYVLIITDYFNDHDLNIFFPKKILEYGKKIKNYKKDSSGNIKYMTSEGWAILAEVE
ncbi:MAG: hypothetical protein Q4A27_02705 [bacterium]|nr:hypothetical protein [bacterium]